MSAPENPPAFPRDIAVRQEGMSLRDWFAGRVLPQVFADVSAELAFRNRTPQELAADVAKLSYQIADAMLAEREKRNDR